MKVSKEINLPRNRSLFLVSATGVLALCSLALGSLALVDAGLANGFLCAQFEARTHRKLSFRRLEFHLLQSDPTIMVEDMDMGSPPNTVREDLVHIGHGVFHVRLLPLLIGHMTLTGVELSQVDLRMVRLGHAHNNYSFSGGGGHGGLSAVLHAVHFMTISQSRVSYVDAQRQLTLISQIDYNSANSPRPLHLDGGGVNHGAPYTVVGDGAPLTGRGPTTPFAFEAKLIDGDVKASIAGSTQKPFDFRDFDLSINGSGPNLADLGYLFGVSIPNTPTFVLSTHATHHDHVVSFQQIRGQLGGSTIAGDFTSDHRRQPRVLTAHVQAGVLRAEDLAVFLSPRPPHAATRSQAGVASRPSGGADRPIDVAAMRQVNVILDLQADKVTGYPVPIGNVRAHLALKDGRLDIRPFSATLTPGEIQASGQAEPSADGLSLRADAVVRDAQAGALTNSKVPSGTFDGVAHLSATGRSQRELLSAAQGSLAFRLRDGTIKRVQAEALAGDPFKAAWAAVTDKAAVVTLTCARGRFALQRGVLTPSDLIIATSKGAVEGHGRIDFVGQTLDLVLSPTAIGGPQPVLNAPIHLSGKLAHPKVGLEMAHAVRQSGMKAVAALVASPFEGKAQHTLVIPCPSPATSPSGPTN